MQNLQVYIYIFNISKMLNEKKRLEKLGKMYKKSDAFLFLGLINQYLENI